MKPKIIGILTSRGKRGFFEPGYFRDWSRAASKLGADLIFFTENDLDLKRRRLRGYSLGVGGRWRRRVADWPKVVIDRRRRDWNPRYKAMRQKPLFTYANRKFTLKSKATRLFAETPEVRQWIPKTTEYTEAGLRSMLQEFPIVYVKPGNGTGGSSVARIKRRNGRFLIWGRQRSSLLRNVLLTSENSVYRWMRAWTGGQRIRSGRFIIQQGLDLELVPGRNVDSRLLIQKNGCGEWSVTGMAVRIGGSGSPTTNLLYGSGRAHAFLPFMTERFGSEKAEEIRGECERMAHAVVKTIESEFGPMMEFGMDVGVDVNGRVWLIEVNPKPSRDVFLKSGEPELYRLALQRPVEYALYLAGQVESKPPSTEEPKNVTVSQAIMETKTVKDTANEETFPSASEEEGKMVAAAESEIGGC